MKKRILFVGNKPPCEIADQIADEIPVPSPIDANAGIKELEKIYRYAHTLKATTIVFEHFPPSIVSAIVTEGLQRRRRNEVRYEIPADPALGSTAVEMIQQLKKQVRSDYDDRDKIIVAGFSHGKLVPFWV